MLLKRMLQWCADTSQKSTSGRAFVTDCGRTLRQKSHHHVNRLVTFPLYCCPRGKQLENQTHHHGNTRGLGKALYFGNHFARLCPFEKRICTYSSNYIWPFSQTTLPHPDEEILSGYEEDVSSIRDDDSAWANTDPENTLWRHSVDVKAANAAFRKAPARKQSPFCQEYHFNNDVPNRLTEQKRLGVNNWNPGHRRGKEGAVEEHIAGKWYIIIN